jgi:hypothetical protein
MLARIYIPRVLGSIRLWNIRAIKSRRRWVIISVFNGYKMGVRVTYIKYYQRMAAGCGFWSLKIDEPGPRARQAMEAPIPLSNHHSGAISFDCLFQETDVWPCPAHTCERFVLVWDTAKGARIRQLDIV